MVGKPSIELLKTDPMRFWVWTALWLIERGQLEGARAVLTDLLKSTENGAKLPTRDVKAELCAAWAEHVG